MFKLVIDINCEIDQDKETLGSFCKSKPTFRVPPVTCPDGQVMVAIDQCGHPDELSDDKRADTQPTSSKKTTTKTTTCKCVCMRVCTCVCEASVPLR